MISDSGGGDISIKKIIQLEKLPLKKNFLNIAISEPQSWVRTPEEGACRNTVELA